jgi:hypothetical protein
VATLLGSLMNHPHPSGSSSNTSGGNGSSRDNGRHNHRHTMQLVQNSQLKTGSSLADWAMLGAELRAVAQCLKAGDQVRYVPVSKKYSMFVVRF